MTISSVVEPISGFAGADPEACLKLKLQVVAEHPVQEATRELDDISASLQSMQPPFVTMRSTQEEPLYIDLSAHWLLMFSLMLVQDDNPQSQFKVMKVMKYQGDEGEKMKNKRKMNIVLQENGSFALARDDQQDAKSDMQYKMEWVSPEIERHWLDLRKCFRESCKRQPEKVKGTQLGLLQTLLATSGLDVQLQQQIKLYCYSTNAWMSLKAGVVDWKVSDYELEHRRGKRWADYTDEETSELLIWDHGLEQKIQQNFLEPAVDKFSKAEDSTSPGVSEPVDVSEQFEVDVFSRDYQKNTFLHFRKPEKSRRARSCPRDFKPLSCGGMMTEDAAIDESNVCRPSSLIKLVSFTPAQTRPDDAPPKLALQNSPTFSTCSTGSGDGFCADNDSEIFDSESEWQLPEIGLPEECDESFIVKNTFIHFPVEQRTDRRRSSLCSQPVRC